jgi:hypothetical protein
MQLNQLERIPKRVFIVPYRNRIEQKFFFCKQMSFIMENETDYDIYFSHQFDERSFNRGAIKNAGFLAIKNKYPNNYKEITFIFNDVDTLPFHKIFDYQTTIGVVKHYYGFTYALGGIFVIKGEDFEKINGFPNYWGWGNEDSCIQLRCIKNNLKIDRSHFYPIGSPEILQLFDGVSRLISREENQRDKQSGGFNGLSTLYSLKYTIDAESKNTNDNKYIVKNDNIYIINVSYFQTMNQYRSNEIYNYDIRDSVRKIKHPDNQNKPIQNATTPKEWKHIPKKSNDKIIMQQETISISRTKPNIQQANHVNVRDARDKFVIGLGGLL